MLGVFVGLPRTDDGWTSNHLPKVKQGEIAVLGFLELLGAVFEDSVIVLDEFSEISGGHEDIPLEKLISSLAQKVVSRPVPLVPSSAVGLEGRPLEGLKGLDHGAWDAYGLSTEFGGEGFIGVDIFTIGPVCDVFLLGRREC